MDRTVRRIAALAAILVLMLAAAPPPARATIVPSAPAPLSALEALVAATKAVTWSVDEEAKIVTATVRLTLATSCTSATMQAMALAGPAMAARCRVDAAAAKAIADNITSVWDNNNRYRCYLLQVVVDVIIDNTPADRRPPTGDDRVVVQIDQTSANITSVVMGTSNAGSTWDGNTPNDRLTPVNGSVPPTTWSYPPAGWKKSLYAHEAAHVMGLDDTYETYVDPADGKTYSRPKAGAPDDALSNIEKTNVDQKTVDRLVERADAFKGSKPKCDYKIDTIISWYHFTSTKCGGPEGDWVIDVEGTYPLGVGSLALSGTGHALLARNAQTAKDGSFAGPWDAAFRIDLEGVPYSIGGQEGTITGDAKLAKSVLHLVGKNAQGEFWAQTPALALGGPSMDPMKSFDLPVTNGSFCP